MRKPNTDLAAMKAHVRDNLKQCAADILVWQRTGLLPAGPVRVAASLMPAELEYEDLKLVEDEVIRQSLQHTAQHA